jgi:hypothetical protein
VSLKSGDTTTVGLTITGSQDLFSIPLMVQYNPAVLSIEEVRDGGFLSGGTQGVARNADKRSSLLPANRTLPA